MGRQEDKLEETKTAIESLSKNTKVSGFVCDVTDDAAVKKIADAVGTWDAVLHCAGYYNKPSPTLTADLDDYWRTFEV